MGLNSNTSSHSGYESIVNDSSFVVSDGTPNSNDKAVQRKIRANAMRDYWRRRKLETKSLPDDGPAQSRSVELETSPGDSDFEYSDRIWWQEIGQPKLSSDLVEATAEAKDCSSRHGVKPRAAKCYLLPFHTATQKTHATHPQRRDTGKNRDHEGMYLKGSNVANLSISIGNSMADPFNASALEGSRHDSFLLSHREYSPSCAMPQLG